MMHIKNDNKSIKNSMEKYLMIRECIKGLYDIFDINFLEKNMYYQLALDNLSSLNDNIIELLKHTHSPREVRMMLREIEFDEYEAQECFPLKQI